jgi:Zn-dependent peptidase ImmA (M78 family)
MAPTTRSKPMRSARLAEAEELAEHVLEKMEMKHPTEMRIEAIACELDAAVRDVPLRGADARILVRPKRKAVIHVRSEYAPKRRFDIGHELGHLLMHIDRSKPQMFDDVHISGKSKKPEEREANVFSSALLMPRRDWQRRVRVAELTLQLVQQLATEYQVSMQAAAIRVAELSPARCCFVYAQGNRVRWASKSATWISRTGQKQYGPFNGQPVPQSTITYSSLEHAKAPEIAEEVAAETWLKGPHVTSRSRLIEHCHTVAADGAVLSLLCIPPSSDL